MVKMGNSVTYVLPRLKKNEETLCIDRKDL